MCDDRERLIGYVYDECDSVERRAIEAHLETCHTCRSEIGALRAVRQDLLAWEVPDVDAAWRPPVPERVVSPWRAVPAWSLAAAAAVVLMVGAAGGAATTALMSRPAGTVAQAATGAPAGLTQADAAVLEQRVLDQLRQEIDGRLQLMRTAAPASPAPTIRTQDEDLTRQLNALRSQQDDLSRAVYGVWAETMGLKTKQNGLEERSNLMLASLVQGQAVPTSGGR